MRKILVTILKWSTALIIIALIFIIGLVQFSKYKLHSTSPQIPSEYKEINYLIKDNNRLYSYGKSWANKNEYGLWEVYLEGGAFERGVAYGNLIEEPVQYQEEVFVNSINKIVPSKVYQWFLKNLIYLFHADINNYVSEELKNEILGVSLFFSDEYDYIGKKYMRILAYHAAHDLGHALNNYSLVGCTSFSTWGKNTRDGDIIHARNFDFYFGDEFAEEKVILMLKPDSGYALISYSWPGMMGVVSGMNEKGLAVTINASMSEPPTSASLPISILVRETLQFTKNLNEAIDYISKREIFVSESIMISSALDNKSIIIEKTPEKQGVFESNELLICSNHFQSDLFVNDSINIKNIKKTDSKHRFNRVAELVNQKETIDVKRAITILRDKQGETEANIGLGNPHAINQLLAHHGVVFEPSKLNMWISTPPYQMGDFICYNLDSIFSNANNNKTNFLQIIEEDSFLYHQEYFDFERWKKTKNKIDDYLLFNTMKPIFNIDTFISLNPESYNTYFILGRYYFKQGHYEDAKQMFKIALTKSLPSQSLINKTNNYLIRIE
tara:strand:- start:23487 stop:25151 length:1665 start_codon:yes stop_codon:yes gene_type:complete